jgi:hypothetical protein
MSAVMLSEHEEPRRNSDSGSLMSIIERAASAADFDVDKLQKLLEVKERWDANEARKAFSEAFAAFKSEAVTIVKNTEVKDGPLKGKKHANLFDVVVAVTPALSAHGLAMSWNITRDEKDWIEVTCSLRHVGGHSESVSMGSGPDTGPGRNAIQARASAKSYLERYTATAILGLAAKDADDDGRGGGQAEYITESQAADLRALADEVGADRAKFLAYMKVEKIADITSAEYTKAVRALESKRKQ